MKSFSQASILTLLAFASMLALLPGLAEAQCNCPCNQAQVSPQTSPASLYLTASTPVPNPGFVYYSLPTQSVTPSRGQVVYLTQQQYQYQPPTSYSPSPVVYPSQPRYGTNFGDGDNFSASACSGPTCASGSCSGGQTSTQGVGRLRRR